MGGGRHRPVPGGAANGRSRHRSPCDQFPLRDYLHDLYGNGLFTTTDLARRDPDPPTVPTLLAGLSYAVAHPGEAAEILHRSTRPPIRGRCGGAAAAGSVRVGRTDQPGRFAGAGPVARGPPLQSIGAVPDWVEPAELAAADLLPVGGAA